MTHEDFLLRATAVCQSRERAETIATNCRTRATTSLESASEWREDAYAALCAGWGHWSVLKSRGL